MRDELMRLADEMAESASVAQANAGSASWRTLRRYETELRALADRSATSDYVCRAHQCRRQAVEMQAEIERLRLVSAGTCKDGLQVDVATNPEKYDDNVWPPTIWLAGDSYAKTRTRSRDPNAVAYVRADDYNELLEWTKRRIIDDELCPCEKPNLPETPDCSVSVGAQSFIPMIKSACVPAGEAHCYSGGKLVGKIVGMDDGGERAE